MLGALSPFMNITLELIVKSLKKNVKGRQFRSNIVETDFTRIDQKGLSSKVFAIFAYGSDAFIIHLFIEKTVTILKELRDHSYTLFFYLNHDNADCQLFCLFILLKYVRETSPCWVFPRGLTHKLCYIKRCPFPFRVNDEFLCSTAG